MTSVDQPVSATVDAARAILLGQGGWAEVWPALAWSAGIVAVFAPLAIRRYRRI